jgi:hypothetical protein
MQPSIGCRIPCRLPPTTKVVGFRLEVCLNRNVAIYNKRSERREQLFLLERLWDPVIPEP